MLDVEALLVEVWVLPCCKAVLEVGSEVVVGGCSPEVGCEFGVVGEHWLSVDIDVGDEACVLAEGDVYSVG